MAKSFWSFFGLYDGVMRCQFCHREQTTADVLSDHETDCSSAVEAIEWVKEQKRLKEMKGGQP